MSKVSIVSGGFDPVHSGHINLMLAARELGDQLIVLLNSDAWLSRKKGRPFMNFFERKMVLENLWFVDHVLDFDDSDDTAVKGLEKVVKMYKPKDDLYFCNGGDRNSLSDIPEKSVAVEANTLVIANVGNFHARGDVTKEWTRNSVHGSIRIERPFIT